MKDMLEKHAHTCNKGYEIRVYNSTCASCRRSECAWAWNQSIDKHKHFLGYKRIVLKSDQEEANMALKEKVN